MLNKKNVGSFLFMEKYSDRSVGSVTILPFSKIMTDRPNDPTANRRTKGFLVTLQIRRTYMYEKVYDGTSILNFVRTSSHRDKH